MKQVRVVYRIPLHIQGIDLDDESTLSVIGESLSDLSWIESDGRVLAVLHTEARDPVGDAIEAARRVRNALPQASVREVDQDIVNVTDISHRLGVSREAVRLWVEGKRGPGTFPSPVGAPGASKVWRWAAVAAWLAGNYRMDFRENCLNEEQAAQVNSALLGTRDSYDTEWETVTSVARTERVGSTGSGRLRAVGALALTYSAIDWIAASETPLSRVSVTFPLSGGETGYRHCDLVVGLEEATRVTHEETTR